MSNTVNPSRLRIRARRRIAEWEGAEWRENYGTKELRALFDHKGSYTSFQNRHALGNGAVQDHDLHNSLLALLGENGYTIYRAMKARRDL